MKDALTPFALLPPEEGVVLCVDAETEARWLSCLEFANANLARRHRLLAVLRLRLALPSVDPAERARLLAAVADVRRAIQGSYRFRHEYAERLGIGETYPLPH